MAFSAVQEERQRGREKSDNEVESTSSFSEDMPVEKILDAELAVEPKTETYVDGSPSNSVSASHNATPEGARSETEHWFGLLTEHMGARASLGCVARLDTVQYELSYRSYWSGLRNNSPVSATCF